MLVVKEVLNTLLYTIHYTNSTLILLIIPNIVLIVVFLIFVVYGTRNRPIIYIIAFIGLDPFLLSIHRLTQTQIKYLKRFS